MIGKGLKSLPVLIICLFMLAGCQNNTARPETATDAVQLTPEAIMDSMKGVWVVDRYIGIVPYETYRNGIWDKSALTEEERMAVYETDKAQASSDLPDFIIDVRENEVEAADEDIEEDIETAAENRFDIYIINDNYMYNSPINVVVSRNVTDYTPFIHRTTDGLELSSRSPIVYVEFNYFTYSEPENSVVYMPATLILSADGPVLLFKGKYYSLKHTLQSEIMSGDWSSVDDGAWWSKSNAYRSGSRTGYYEWQIIDLNGDGTDDMLLQERWLRDEERPWPRVVAIFACEADSAELLLWDNSDDSEYVLCSPEGELMYYSDVWNRAISTESYRYYHYDSEWNNITDFWLVGNVVDSSIDGSEERFRENHQNWINTHPDMAGDGYYYSLYRPDEATGERQEREALTYEEFKEIFEDTMGMEFNGLRY